MLNEKELGKLIEKENEKDFDFDFIMEKCFVLAASVLGFIVFTVPNAASIVVLLKCIICLLFAIYYKLKKEN